jgi:hypothetical protein
MAACGRHGKHDTPFAVDLAKIGMLALERFSWNCQDFGKG